MTFWSSDTLKDKLPELITPFSEEKIEQSSYTLRIGKEIFVTKDRHNNDSQHTKRSLETDPNFVIPPGQFAFLLTEESVSVPSNAIAFISMKASFKFKGLINISGFHVDPGFSGNLLFSVYNAGPSPIHLERYTDCFLIWYANLDSEDSRARKRPGFNEIPTSVLNQISTDEIYSLQTLTKEFRDVELEVAEKINQFKLIEQQINFTKWVTWVTAGFIISFIAYMGSTIFGLSKFAIQQKDLVHQISEYKEVLDDLLAQKKKNVSSTIPVIKGANEKSKNMDIK